ncbi:transposase InsO family protein [Aquimarina sp. EL_43]|uniref:integrase core domain-containing protein n=1 Tax=unclassified Aquimarina TaxID=2627091 RepID=UPI0018C96F48|nr:MULTISPECIES: integrase core domain-containing protein [unclassified Aquimarina]MBG6133805.1 transposase InsO family protein [Aquimarina sp. EL_35]MBG6153962.1 transposase InsO family protein [Aquimarina sp. EL_32]MBG6172195.1 transposase InsO family protein [Aquimarina sp. EL_43]
MKQKIEFICEWRTGKYTITELCKSFGVSRPTAYKLIHRFENQGFEGLKELSRKPGKHPNTTDQKIIESILKLKEKYKLWGAKKIRVLLFKEFPKEQIPSVVTVHNILRKNGLVSPQKRMRRVKPIHPIFDPKNCNEVWSADYKGKFLMGNKIYCHPLTIADSKSRFLFAAKGHYKETLKAAKTAFTKVFRTYGIPKQIHTDNGSPFGSVRAIQRFTQLSYWFIELGIIPVFSDPAHPEQNGRHERMHRDLKAACAKPSAFDLKAQQRRLNHFVKEYNHIRPHEALDMKTPADVHDFSCRPFPEKIKDFDYDSKYKILKVTKSGAIRWKSYYWVYLTAALKGKYVGIQELGNGIWKVYYRNVFLGFFDQRNLRHKQQSTRLETNLV